MPNVSLGLNDKVLYDLKGKNSNNTTVEMDDLKFHKCVDLNKFESERSIDFVPPDGEIELMSYRLDIQVRILIHEWIKIKYDTLYYNL